MEIVLWVLWSFTCFGIGVWTGSDVKKIFRARNKRALLTINPKPRNEFSDYTIDELETHKKYLEKEYRDHLHYPVLRQMNVEELKKVLQMLNWHYIENGTLDLEEQRERTRRELAEFDQKYAAALRGH